MNKSNARKLDLLPECNDRGQSLQEFKAMFCNHCRNSTCANAEGPKFPPDYGRSSS